MTLVPRTDLRSTMMRVLLRPVSRLQRPRRPGSSEWVMTFGPTALEHGAGRVAVYLGVRVDAEAYG
jgi:hypothetical protein